MVKLTTVSAGFGVLTGVWTAVASYTARSSVPTLGFNFALSLAILLVIDSLLCLVGPRRIFYTSAFLSAILVAVFVLGSAANATAVVLITLGMAGVTFVLSILAARSEPKVSEQSNPMNLPVFG